MRLTARQLNRATLGRQLLLRRESLEVVDAVHRVVALQGQEPPSMYVALWDRLDDFDPTDLDRAFVDGSVVKATLMRIAIHAVDATDYPAFHEGMQVSLRGSRLGDPRFTVAGLSVAEADALVPELRSYASQPRTGPEIEAWLDERLAPRPGRPVWWAIRTYGPFHHVPTGRPWSFGQPRSYVAAPEFGPSGDPEVSLPLLARRYLEGFGPASVQDLAQFGMIHRSRARAALRALLDAGEAVSFEGPDGAKLFDVPGGLLPPEDTPAPPRLLPMWDSTLLAYVDRSRIIPPEYRPLVTRNNGDVLPTMLVDGYVAGVWRPVEDGIEATAFHQLPDDAWEGLEAEARGMLAFLADREPMIYHGRYAHWWTKIPSAEVRVLATRRTI
jgi:Winged helix DNA-binding domain